MSQAVPNFIQPDVQGAQSPSSSTGSPASFSPPSDVLAQSSIAQLAYALWQQEGCPDGSAEKDWLEAEQKLRDASIAAAPEMIRH
jgi:Protein of unknown function (DUF2934)